MKSASAIDVVAWKEHNSEKIFMDTSIDHMAVMLLDIFHPYFLYYGKSEIFLFYMLKSL